MLRYSRRQVSLRTCSILYILTLILNFLLCYFFFIDTPTQHITPPPHSCSCPSPLAPSVVTCATPPPTQNEPSPRKDAVEDDRHAYLLVVMVLSSLSGRDRRDTIRQTWAMEKPRNVLVMFALGTEGVAPADMEDIQMEADTHHDLLQLPSLRESYSNLTRKVLYALSALDRKFRFSYLLKCDDDTFLLLDTLASELGQRSSPWGLYWGFFDGRAHVKRRGKWAEKDWFLCDRYLPYALGGGYVISHDLVRRIVANSDGLTLYNSEDVSVGVWLSPYDTERRHDVRFNTEFVSRGCRNQYIVSHKQSAEDMFAKHRTLEHKGVQCEKEYQTRASYVYNWTTDPTKCCERRNNVA